MKIIVNDREVNLPISHQEVTIGQVIDFDDQYGREFKERFQKISEIEDDFEMEVELASYNFDLAMTLFAFFAGATVEAVKESRQYVDEIFKIGNDILKPLIYEHPTVDDQQRLFEWNGDIWALPEPLLIHGSPMTFGEFIDAKQLIKDQIEVGVDKLEYLPKICAIFLRRQDEAYAESFLYENSHRLQLMHSLPMDIAAAVSVFFDKLNEFIAESFPVFGPSRVKSSGRNMKDHFNRWGWINFLKSIAQTKVFDMPGINSIESARRSKLFDILVYASEEKEFGEAQALDMQEKNNS